MLDRPTPLAELHCVIARTCPDDCSCLVLSSAYALKPSLLCLNCFPYHTSQFFLLPLTPQPGIQVSLFHLINLILLHTFYSSFCLAGDARMDIIPPPSFVRRQALRKWCPLCKDRKAWTNPIHKVPEKHTYSSNLKPAIAI
jgi:hypothetical protein